MKPALVLLNPRDLDNSMRHLAATYDLSPQTLETLRQILSLFPRPACVTIDKSNRLYHENLPLTDKFTFDTENDNLVLFNSEPENFIDGFVEMAMYLSGFTTLLGNADEWVIEFAIGAWKPVKNRIKRQLDIPVREHPRGVVGLPPPPDQAPPGDPYPFRTLVSRYDYSSFRQMVILASRDDIAVYFPTETHPKVLSVYVYMRRAMQEIAEGIGIKDCQTFNTRLLQTIQHLEELFQPSALLTPNSMQQLRAEQQHETLASTSQPAPDESVSDQTIQVAPPDDPFEAFIEELFPDDDFDDWDVTR